MNKISNQTMEYYSTYKYQLKTLLLTITLIALNTSAANSSHQSKIIDSISCNGNKSFSCDFISKKITSCRG